MRILKISKEEYQKPIAMVINSSTGKDEDKVELLCIACDGSCWKCQIGPEKI